MLALSFGLCASVCWGLADFLGGVQTRRLSSVVVVLVSQAVGLVALGCLVMATTGSFAMDGGLAWAILAGLAGAVGITSFYQALSIGTMSVVAPIAATGAVVPVALGLLSGERPGMLQAAGIVVAMGGVMLVTQDGQQDEHARRSSRHSVALALVAAACIGLALAALDGAAEGGVLQAVWWSRTASVLLLAAAAYAMGRTLQSAGPRLGGLAAIGLLDTGATALYAVATTHGLLSFAAVTSSVYPVTTIVLARTLLAERIRCIQAVGIATALTGITALAAG